MRRSEFIKVGLVTAAGTVLPGRGMLQRLVDEETRITILYTNDTHSRVDPFPETAVRFGGMGGMIRRAELIRRIRNESPNTLLFDSGDLLYGTSWFELYGGRVEMELMDRMGYDAMCLGEHELIRGVDAFAELAAAVELPILCANYRFKGTGLESRIEPYRIIQKAGVKFGVFGLGVRYFDYLSEEQYGTLRYASPLFWAERLVRHLREGHRCDYVICLSHLGYRTVDGGVDDRTLAREVPGIDLILGGHSHTFLSQPDVVCFGENRRTIITQAGHSGLRLGRIDLSVGSDGSVEEQLPSPYIVDSDKRF